jgi:hypothetical protein
MHYIQERDRDNWISLRKGSTVDSWILTFEDKPGYAFAVRANAKGTQSPEAASLAGESKKY